MYFQICFVKVKAIISKISRYINLFISIHLLWVPGTRYFFFPTFNQQRVIYLVPCMHMYTQERNVHYIPCTYLFVITFLVYSTCEIYQIYFLKKNILLLGPYYYYILLLLFVHVYMYVHT